MSRTKEYAILGILLILTAAVRCLHLLTGQFPICNPDSFYFHWLSRQNSIPVLGSGLAYPLRYLGDTGAIVIPPLLGVATALIIYFLARKMYGVKVALWSVACFACAMLAYIHFSAGNIDRDGLSLLLITIALVIWHYSQTWKGALGIAAIATLLAIEWTWVGPAILGAIIIVNWIAEWYVTGKPTRLQVIGVLAGLCLLVLPIVRNR